MEPTAKERQADPAWTPRMLMVLALAGVLFFARLSDRALWSEEVRWAQIPREMLQSGDYFWPTINGSTYYDKPLGSYWLVLIASLVTGGVNETSARLPSACAGMVAVAFAMLIGRRLYDEATALWTGVILATSFSFVFFARNASTDVETVAGILVACWIFLRNESKAPGWWTVGLWLVMALTSLTKGLLGFVLPILIFGIYSTLAKPRDGSLWACAIRQNGWFLNRWSLAAIPLAASVYLAPFVMSMAFGGGTDGLEMVYRENIRRFFDPVNHRAPIYLYGYVIFALLAPWSLLLPAALWHAHASDDEAPRGRAFCLAFFWVVFVFFTLSSSRRSYYLLPILPAGALLIGRLLSGGVALGRVAYALLIAGFGLVALVSLLSIGVLWAGAWLLPQGWDGLPALPFIVLWMIAQAAIIHVMADVSARQIGAALAMIAFSSMTFYFLFALPALEPLRTQKPFADAVRQTVGHASDTLAVYRTRDIVYYLDTGAPVAEPTTSADLQTRIDAGAIRWLITRRRDWEELRIYGTIIIEEKCQPWDTADTARNKLLLVAVSRTP